MPAFVSVEPAAICQLRCPECPVGMRDTRPAASRDAGKYMSPEIWERVLREVSPYVHTIQFFFQGEPLLNKHLARMVRDAHAQYLYTIVSTNAQAMTRETAMELMSAGLSRIIVSIDGLSDESYGAYRVGGSLQKSLQALQWLREAKQACHSRCTIEMQCLKLRTNEHEWPEMRRRYRELGADRLTLKTAQLYDFEHGHPLMPSRASDSRYEQAADGTYRMKQRRRWGCLRLWSGAVITASGEVLPCCYDKSGKYSFGNITEHSLRSLFHNEKARQFRRQVLRFQPAICHNCWQ